MAFWLATSFSSTHGYPIGMQPLLALVNEAVDSFADEPTATRIHARAAELRQSLGFSAGSVSRVEALVAATADVLSLPLADAYRLIGERAMAPLTKGLSPVLRSHTTAHTCCLNLNAIVQEELQPLVPTLSLPVVDVEMVDAETLRISLIASDEALGLMCGLLVGLASQYQQVVRFTKVPLSHVSPAALAAGRRYLDVRFRHDTRVKEAVPKPGTEERRLNAVVVALQSLFR